jgi:spore coat protein U-like protein
VLINPTWKGCVVKISLSLMPRAISYFAAALLCCAPLASQAGTSTGTLGVSATIPANCVFGTSTMPFGVYEPITTNAATALTATGTVNLTCSKSDAITITANAGANGASASGTCATAVCTRAMKNGTSFLSYDLYTTALDATVWNATNSIAATGTGVSQAVSIFGFVPAASNEPAGAYADTVTVTATF